MYTLGKNLCFLITSFLHWCSVIDETYKGVCRILIWGAGVPNWVGIKDVIKH